MRSKILNLGLITTLTLSGFIACDYEMKDTPPNQEIEEASDDGQGDQEAAQKERREDKPIVIPPLISGKPYTGSTTVPADAKMIDLLNLAATEQAILSTNVPNQETTNIFDGNPETLFRSPDINPVITTIALKNPIKLRAVRVRSTYSDYGVAVQVDGGERITLEPIPDGDWATFVWPNAVNAKTIVVHTLRKVRDNVVHLNEIEIYQ
jgi:hypothetical protein